MFWKYFMGYFETTHLCIHSHCITDRDIEIVETIKRHPSLNKTLLKYFKGRTMEKMFETPDACIYKDCGSKWVIKIFKDTYRGKLLCDVEKRAYKTLAGTKHVTQMVSHSEEPLNYILMPHMGEDCLDFSNRVNPPYKLWAKMICEMVPTLNEIHQKGLYHGDIKLENITYNGSEFNLIDFGFAFGCNNKMPKNRFCGTYPYVIPTDAKEKFDSDDAFRKASDMFAMALSFLSFAGVYHDEVCDVCKYQPTPCYPRCSTPISTRIDIHKITRVHQDVGVLHGSNWRRLGVLARPLVELVCEIVLTQIDITKRYIIWSKGKCEYWDTNTVTSEVYYTKIGDAWSQLSELVSNIHK